MAKDSKIAWTDHTFNPWTGCTKVSPGCANCYAETLSKRFGGRLGEWGPGQARVRTSAANWREPVKWNKEAGDFCECGHCGWRGVMPFHEVFHPLSGGKSDEFRYCPQCSSEDLDEARPRVFCASMADWLDHEVPIEWLADLLALISATPHLDWLLLTKRPELCRSRVMAAADNVLCERGSEQAAQANALAQLWLQGTPPTNVWLGTTVEDQARADERIPALLRTPARVRFLSCEPMLESIALRLPLHIEFCAHARASARTGDTFMCTCPRRSRIDWVICGGESGSNARPFDLAWARSLRDQCAAANVPFFMKQLGANIVGEWDPAVGKILTPNRLQDRAGADPAEWPDSLRVQQFPTT